MPEQSIEWVPAAQVYVFRCSACGIFARWAEPAVDFGDICTEQMSHWSAEHDPKRNVGETRGLTPQARADIDAADDDD